MGLHARSKNLDVSQISFFPNKSILKIGDENFEITISYWEEDVSNLKYTVQNKFVTQVLR